MKNWKFLTGVIFFIGVFMLMGLGGKAHAWTWYGFSSLCYEGQFKGSPDTIVELEVINLNVHAGCLNIRDNSFDCKSGDGNSGSFSIGDIPSAYGDKSKGLVYFNGCIDLTKYDDHSLQRCEEQGADPENCHQHICLPLDNINKEEILNSAYIATLDVYYSVLNSTNGKLKYKAKQHCTYPGQIDPDTCEPPHYDPNDPNSKVYFVCSEEEIIN